MDRLQITLGLCLDKLGINLSRVSWEKYQVVRYTTYLMKAAGIDLGHHYGWHLNGPYSKQIGDDFDALNFDSRYGMNDSNGWKLGNKSIKILESIRPLIKYGKNWRQLRLLACVHYLNNRGEKNFKKLLDGYEMLYSERQISWANRTLKKYKLI